MLNTNWRMLTHVLYISLFTMLFYQCKENSVEDLQIDKLFDEVMAIHDDVMPKMSNIHKLRKQLKEVKKETQNQPISVAIAKLDAADESMMDWMHKFKKPKKKSFEEATAYLTAEKDKISEVKKEMLKAISEAEDLLK